jgi:hypothetical protein
MNRFNHFLSILATLMVLGTILIFSGCSGDDPAAPVAPVEKASLVEPSDEDLSRWRAAQTELNREGGTDGSDYNLGVSKLPYPDTPDQLMENFQTVYETMDVEEYLHIMHQDFVTILQDQTIQEFPDVGPTLNRYEEQNIHKRMFSGWAVTDPEGYLVPGVESISFEVLHPLDVWQMSPGDDPIPNAEYAPFAVQITLDRGPSYSSLRVEGVIKFYVTSQSVLYQGERLPYYQMLGQVDLTGGTRVVEEAIWGSVKALWR